MHFWFPFKFSGWPSHPPTWIVLSFPPLLPFKIRAFLWPLLNHVLCTDCIYWLFYLSLGTRWLLGSFPCPNVFPKLQTWASNSLLDNPNQAHHLSPQTYFQTPHSLSVWWSHNLPSTLVHSLGRPISLKDPVSTLSSETFCPLPRLLQPLNIPSLWIYLLSSGLLQPLASCMPPQPILPSVSPVDSATFSWFSISGVALTSDNSLGWTQHYLPPYPSSALFFLFPTLSAPAFPPYPQLGFISGLFCSSVVPHPSLLARFLASISLSIHPRWVCPHPELTLLLSSSYPSCDSLVTQGKTQPFILAFKVLHNLASALTWGLCSWPGLSGSRNPKLLIDLRSHYALSPLLCLFSYLPCLDCLFV